jgi:hypothetical protein
MGGFGYASGSVDGNMIVEMSGTLKPDGSAKSYSGVAGYDGPCCEICVGPNPNVDMLAVDEVGVRPGTASRKSEPGGDVELKLGFNPRFARCV